MIELPAFGFIVPDLASQPADRRRIHPGGHRGELAVLPGKYRGEGRAQIRERAAELGGLQRIGRLRDRIISGDAPICHRANRSRRGPPPVATRRMRLNRRVARCYAGAGAASGGFPDFFAPDFRGAGWLVSSVGAGVGSSDSAGAGRYPLVTGASPGRHISMALSV